MEPSDNYQTTVDTDTFHPREADPADVARVSPRPSPSPLVPLEISSKTPETPSRRLRKAARDSPRRAETTPASLSSTSTAESPLRWTPWDRWW